MESPDRMWQYDLSHGGCIGAFVTEGNNVFLTFERPLEATVTDEQIQALAHITSYTREDGTRLSNLNFAISKEAASKLIELLDFVLRNPS